MKKWIKSMMAKRALQRDLGLSKTRYIHVSVDLIVVARYVDKIEKDKDGKMVATRVQDGWSAKPTPKAEHTSYVRTAPKRQSKTRARHDARRGNNWGADWYHDQRSQARLTQRQQRTAAEWKALTVGT